MLQPTRVLSQLAQFNQTRDHVLDFIDAIEENQGTFIGIHRFRPATLVNKYPPTRKMALAVLQHDIHARIQRCDNTECLLRESQSKGVISEVVVAVRQIS